MSTHNLKRAAGALTPDDLHLIVKRSNGLLELEKWFMNIMLEPSTFFLLWNHQYGSWTNYILKQLVVLYLCRKVQTKKQHQTLVWLLLNNLVNSWIDHMS